MEKGSSELAACKTTAEELGIPLKTARTWQYRIASPEATPKPHLDPAPAPDVEETVREMRPETPRPKTYRPDPNEETMVVSYEFNAAFETMLAAIQNARADGWKATPRRAALRHIAALYSIAEGGD
jgi:hypothetical protein